MPSSPLRVPRGSERASPGWGYSMAAQPGTLHGRTIGSDFLKSTVVTPNVPPLIPGNKTMSMDGPHRIRSAVQSRPRVTPPSRSARSAGLTRSLRGTPPCQDGPWRRGPVIPARPPSRELGKVVNILHRRTPTPVITVDNTEDTWMGAKLDYDVQLNKHGWRMEVPGDPFGLKQPCLSARLPFTERLIDPDNPPPHMSVSGLGPSFKRSGWGTYFLNTVPKHLATFDIHPEFFSEFIKTKRIELSDRPGTDTY